MPNKKDFNHAKQSFKTGLQEMKENNRGPILKFINRFKAIKKDFKDCADSYGGIHNFKDLKRVALIIYNHFPPIMKKIIREGLIVCGIVFGMFFLIGLFTLSFSIIATGIILAILGIAGIDAIAIIKYPINGPR